MKTAFIFPILILVLLGLPGTAYSSDILTGTYKLESISDASLDFRKIFFIFKKNHVIGYFDNPATRPYMNNNGDPTCRFFLAGIQTGNIISLRSSSFNPTNGRITTGAPIKLTRTGSTWRVSVIGDLPNCDVPTIADGDSITFQHSNNWVGFASVKTPKAALYQTPDESAKTPSYLIRSDAVAILSTVGGWTKIDYFSGGADLIRWMRTKDLGIALY